MRNKGITYVRLILKSNNLRCRINTVFIIMESLQVVFAHIQQKYFKNEISFFMFMFDPTLTMK